MTFVEFCERVLGLTFEPGQKVFWAVAADGVQPCELEGDDRRIARELFGDLDEIPDECRGHVAVVKGADVGFSYFGGLRLLHRALTATELGAPGEIRPALCVGPDLRIGRIAVRNALGAAESVPEIARLIESKSTDGFVLKREGGRFTSVECLPATVGGRALRGRRYVEVLFDEAAFFRDSNYAVNDVDCRRAVTSRCLGTFWNGSTPGLESSDVWQTFESNYGNPTTALAVRMPTLLVRSDPRVKRLVEAETERDPEGAAVEYDCKPPSGGGGFFFDGYAIDEAASDFPIVLSPEKGWTIVAALDPAFNRDASAGVIVRARKDEFQIVEVFERIPRKGQPLVPSELVREFAALCEKHGATRVASDIHYQETVREHLPRGLRFVKAPGGNSGKAEMFGQARDQIHAGQVKWSKGHRKLTQQLREVTAVPLAGGLVAIRSPRRKGAHGDLASALCLALWLAKRTAGVNRDHERWRQIFAKDSSAEGPSWGNYPYIPGARR